MNNIQNNIELIDNKLNFYEKLFINFKNIVLSKSLWGALILAIALWIFASFNDTYLINIDLPLKINLPKDRAFETKVPKNITFRIKGNGWSLFNLMYFNSAKKCNVNLSNYTINSNELYLTRDVLLKSIEFIGNTSAQEVYPDKLTLVVGQNVEKQVPLISKVKINPSSQFTMVGKQILTPNKITIFGNKKVIDKIEEWETEKIVFNNIKNDFKTKVKINEQLENIVKTREKYIYLKQNIEQLCDYEIKDIPIEIIGNLPNTHKLSPLKVSIIIRGGINSILNLNVSDIQAILESKLIINDKTGFIAPNVTLPENLQIIDIKPKFIRHIIYN